MALFGSDLSDTQWRITTVKPAGTASTGRRQVLHFARKTTPALCEYDVWAVRRSPAGCRKPQVPTGCCYPKADRQQWLF